MKRFFSYFVVFVLGFVACAWTIQHYYGSPLNFSAESAGPVEHRVPKDLFTGNPVRTAAAKVSAFVVNIDTIGHRDDDPYSFFFGEPRQQQGQGSGVIFTPDGYIVTNNHVVQNADKITVTLNNDKQYQAKLIGRDSVTDLAVIKIDATGLPRARFANSDTLAVGDSVIAVGSPFGYKWTVTAGVVSGLSRQLPDGPERLIQTDAAINMGNSGGALADLAGKVVGINRIIVSPSGGNIGLGFAIPSNTVRRVANELKDKGKVVHPWVGIRYGPYNEERRSFLKQRGATGLPEKDGVEIGEVVPGSPAADAGVRPGDVILEVNGKPISGMLKAEKGKTTFADEVAKAKVGQLITMTIWHQADGRLGEVGVRIGEMPAEYSR